MTPTDEAALDLWQANRETDRVVLGALLDECLAPAEYIAELETVRNAMSEGNNPMSVCGVEDVGHLTRGVWDNLMDLSNTWALYPHRRSEFGRREIQDLEDAQRLLRDLMHEITKCKQEAA